MRQGAFAPPLRARQKPKLAALERGRFARRMGFWLKKFVSVWLMPLTACITAMVVGAILMRSPKPKRARFGRALAITGLVMLMLFSNKFVSRFLLRPIETKYPPIPELLGNAPVPPQLAACRYVVVLGGGHGDTDDMSSNNLLSTSALARIIEAVRLLRVLPEARLIVSGPGRKDAPTHAVVLGRVAQSLGIAAERIHYIDQARDTEEEAHAARRISGDAPVAVVTSAWHMPRSIALFRSAGFQDPLPCPSDFKSHARDGYDIDDFFASLTSLERSTVAIRERIGYLWIWLRGKT
jgi:uncharacterized SAM-binding protein YcdF (DUF218 family)